MAINWKSAVKRSSSFVDVVGIGAAMGTEDEKRVGGRLGFLLKFLQRMNFNSFNQQDFSLRPPAEDLGITRISALVVLVIFHLSHFLLTQSKWKQILLDQESKQ